MGKRQPPENQKRTSKRRNSADVVGKPAAAERSIVCGRTQSGDVSQLSESYASNNIHHNNSQTHQTVSDTTAAESLAADFALANKSQISNEDQLNEVFLRNNQHNNIFIIDAHRRVEFFGEDLSHILPMCLTTSYMSTQFEKTGIN